MGSLPFCVLFVLSFTYRANAVDLSSIETFYKVFHFTTGTVEDLVELYDEFGDETSPLKRRERKLLDGMEKMTTLIGRVESNIAQVTVKKIDDLEGKLGKEFKFQFKTSDLSRQVNFIENMFRDFLTIKNDLSKKVHNSTEKEAIALKRNLENFANAVITWQGDSIRKSLSEIHAMIDIHQTASIVQRSDLFSLILENFNGTGSTRCFLEKSPQQLIFEILTSLRLVQLKGVAMTDYAYLILGMYDGGDYKSYAEKFRAEMASRFNTQTDVASKVIERADNSFWRCDPETHEPGTTFTEITRLLQGYIINEKELSDKKNCHIGCRDYRLESRVECRHNVDKLCNSQPDCKGRIVNCAYVQDDLDVCFAVGNATHPPTRRYEWIQWRSGGPTYGNTQKSCEDGPRYFDKHREWYVVVKCYYCFCMCDDETNSDRYFSLEEMTSDIEQNKVVVGVRFEKQNRTIHLRVKQATLLPMGTVDNATVSWVKLPYISLWNPVTDKPQYHKLSFESRSFDLDDLVAPRDYLVTGVRMRLIGSHLNVQIRVTAFDFITGKLFPNLTYWKGNDNTDAIKKGSRRIEFDLSAKRRLSTDESSVRSTPDAPPNSFIQFQPSDEYTDAAQSTVPFIDIQDVTPNPPVPLVGFGVIHKGSSQSAGFIEPKVHTLNPFNYPLRTTEDVDEAASAA